jgi:hypothetical protein
MNDEDRVQISEYLILRCSLLLMQADGVARVQN